MRFRLQTDYALKAMLYLTTKGDENCTTEEIANLYQISAAHLGRVIRRLQGHGFVKAIRGRRGGVRLDRDPATLTLGEVVDTLEEGGNLFELPEQNAEDATAQAERIKAVLRRGQGLFLNYLMQVTFAELIARPAMVPSELTPARAEVVHPTGVSQAPVREPAMAPVAATLADVYPRV